MSQDVSQDEFKEVVENGEGVIIVDFWAAWCPPCRALTPLLEQVDDEMGDKVKVVKVNVDENQQLAMEHGISGIPTVKLYKDGEEKETWIGLSPKSVYVDAVEKYA